MFMLIKFGGGILVMQHMLLLLPRFGELISACWLTECGFPSCSVNPARGFGPAMVSRTFHQYWIFWVGPLTGAAVAAVIYQTVFKVRVSNI